jgi:hypothetical protein
LSSSTPDTTSPEDKEWLAAEKKFEDSTQLGDSAFMYSSWPAWSMVPSEKRLAPIVRIVFGDLSGNVLFDRAVILTGVADLLSELSYTFLDQVTRASELTGFSFDVPGDPATMLNNLNRATEQISAALELLNKTDLIKNS